MINNDLAFIILELINDKPCDDLLEEIAILIKNNPYKQICIFNAYSEKIDNKNVPILPISHAKFFYGDMLVFDTASLMLIKDFPNLKNKYYYTQSTEWIDGYNNYFIWHSLLCQNNLHIIAQNNTIYDMYDICWQQPLGVMSSFSHKELQNVLR